MFGRILTHSRPAAASRSPSTVSGPPETLRREAGGCPTFPSCLPQSGSVVLRPWTAPAYPGFVVVAKGTALTGISPPATRGSRGLGVLRTGLWRPTPPLGRNNYPGPDSTQSPAGARAPPL